MSKVRFYLKDPNANKLETPRGYNEDYQIFLNFSFNGKRLRYYTGERINPKFWNKDEQRARKSRQFPEYPDLNAKLDKLASETKTIYRRFQNEGKVPSIAQLKSELDLFVHRGIKPGETSLFGFIEQFINERSGLPRFSPNTIITYRTVYNHLKTFSTQKRRSLDFEDIDLDFFQDFQEYLFSSSNQFSQNTGSKYVAILKTMLHEATERGINKNRAYQSRRFSVSRVEVENIYLTKEELIKIYRLKLEEYLPRLDKVRDLFLIGAFTGLRFSDFTNIKPENIKRMEGVEVIQITTKKTGEQVFVPVHPIVKTILEKYEGEIPKPLSNQKMNVYLKELAELAEINEDVIITKNKGGKRYDKKFKKFEMVTTHTARRSFATNAFKAGIPAISIMKITGHRTEKSFMKYIKISKEENALLISQNDFFKGTSMKAIS